MGFEFNRRTPPRLFNLDPHQDSYLKIRSLRFAPCDRAFGFVPQEWRLWVCVAWIHASVFAPREARIKIRTSMQIFTTHFLSLAVYGCNHSSNGINFFIFGQSGSSLRQCSVDFWSTGIRSYLFLQTTRLKSVAYPNVKWEVTDCSKSFFWTRDLWSLALHAYFSPNNCFILFVISYVCKSCYVTI